LSRTFPTFYLFLEPRCRDIEKEMTEKPLTDPADHARDFARRWEDKLEEHCAVRMQQLGITDNMNGQPDYGRDGQWRAFDYRDGEGGRNTTGVVVDSGVLNPVLLKGQKGGRIWRCMRLRDRIDAIIAHEYEELRAGGNHAQAVRNAAKTELPISDQARRLNRARAR
jgi:hypothetical protein